jgi:hypothetical protein
MNQTTSHMVRLCALSILVAAPVSAQLPDAKQIVDRSIQASGGAAVIRKHTNIYMSGKFEMPAQAITGTIQSWNADNRIISVVEIPAIGSVRSGYDGETAWQIHPAMGASLMSGKSLEQMKQQADVLAVLTPEKYIKSRVTVEKTTFDGKEAYRVKTVLHNGEEYFDIYDAKSHLPIGLIRTLDSPMGAIETTTVFAEYQSFDGHQMPTKIRQTAMASSKSSPLLRPNSGPSIRPPSTSLKRSRH